MAVHIIFILTSLLQIASGQQQMVAQYLNPSQAGFLSSPSTQGPQGLLSGPAASLGQILVNLLNYKLQWLNQLAGHLTGNPVNSVKPSVLQLPGGHHPGFPFMTTLVTTLSGNSPSVPGIHISGAPVNHLAYPGAPGAPGATTPPPQDFHWIPVLAPGPQNPPGAAGLQPLPGAPAPVPQPPQAPGPQPAAPVPVVPPVDDFSPIETIAQAPGTAAPQAAAATTVAPTTTTTTTTPKP